MANKVNGHSFSHFSPPDREKTSLNKFMSLLIHLKLTTELKPNTFYFLLIYLANPLFSSFSTILIPGNKKGENLNFSTKIWKWHFIFPLFLCEVTFQCNKISGSLLQTLFPWSMNLSCPHVFQYKSQTNIRG